VVAAVAGEECTERNGSRPPISNDDDDPKILLAVPSSSCVVTFDEHDIIM
jgi:hypothetical protein